MAQPCPNQTENEKRCPCSSKSCPRHGVCCACVDFHRQNGGKPACMAN